MRQIFSFVKIVFLFLVVGTTSILGFFGIGKSDESDAVFGGLDFSNSIAHADHTSCTSGTQCSSTGGGGDHADCSTGCADSDGSDGSGCSCGNSGNADSDSGNSGAGDGSSN